MQKIPRSFGTHDGTFHADEVTACALLLLFNLIDEDKIHRTRNPQVLETCEFVCDVGGVYNPDLKLFDHHQVEYQGSLSSAGMILLYLKNIGILQPNDYEFFNSMIVYGVDAHDNGKEGFQHGVCTYSHIISNFTPLLHDVEPEEQDAAFMEALHFARGHLTRMWERHLFIRSCKQIVMDTMAKYKECLMFDQGIPWLEMFFDLDGAKHPAQFVIMPAGKHWKLRGIPPTIEERMKVRIPLPSDWAGLLDDELKKATGIPGAIFCHKGRFISVWETREDAIRALELVMKMRGK